MEELNLSNWVVAWAAMAGVVLFRHWRPGRSVGLLLTYILSFAALHWLMPLLYLLPWSDTRSADLVGAGLRESTLAMLGLLVGAEFGAVWESRIARSAESRRAEQSSVGRLINWYLMAAVFTYGLSLFGGRLPLIDAVVSTGSTLIAVSIGLKCWQAWQEGYYSRMALWLASSALFPIVTVLTQGFLGYGFIAALIILTFVASLQASRWKTVAVGAFVVYAGLSVYVTYMRDRTDIRDVVWGGEGAQVRVAQLQNTFSTAEWFDPANPQHLDRVYRRLNQNVLVGAAMFYLRDGNEPYANGATLVTAAAAVIPRALWPDKPVFGGSGDLVSTYTGLRFAFGTSVGIGQVMELYVNFATTGVVLGFGIIGALVVLVDRRAATHLTNGNIRSFALWYVPGLSLLQIGGAIGEVTATAAASWVLVTLASSLAEVHRRRNVDGMVITPVSRAEHI